MTEESDIIITVRMPEQLLERLRSDEISGYYIDISERIRSILREKWLEAHQPQVSELKKLRGDIGVELRKRSQKLIQDRVVGELNRIKKDLQRDLE